MTEGQMLPNDRFYFGGLMRCCLEALHDMYPDGPARIATEGQKLSCKYWPDNPGHQMVFKDGGWHWDKPEDPEF